MFCEKTPSHTGLTALKVFFNFAFLLNAMEFLRELHAEKQFIPTMWFLCGYIHEQNSFFAFFSLLCVYGVVTVRVCNG